MDAYKERQKDTDTKGVFQMESNGKVAHVFQDYQPYHCGSQTTRTIWAPCDMYMLQPGDGRKTGKKKSRLSALCQLYC